MIPARRLVVALLAVLVIGAGFGPSAATAAPRTWNLVALGDSIPYGGSWCGGCTPYPTLLARSLRRQSGHLVAVKSFAVPGLSAAQLATNVRTKAALRAAIANADVVTITIGHNDTPWNSHHDACDGDRAWYGTHTDARWTTYTGSCLALELARLGSRLRGILFQIRHLRGGRPTLVELTTDWNQLIGAPGITATPRAVSKAVLDRYAALTCAAARAWSARCGDVYHAFNGPLGTRAAGVFLAADHDHASQRGHQEIAAILGAFGYAPLAP